MAEPRLQMFLRTGSAYRPNYGAIATGNRLFLIRCAEHHPHPPRLRRATFPQGKAFCPTNPNSPQGSLPAAFSQFRFSFLVVRKYMIKYPPTMVTADRTSMVPMTLKVLFSAPLPTRTVTSMIVHTRLMP